MTFQRVLDQHFPGSLGEEQFVVRSRACLQPLGFDSASLVCVGTCRDELCLPLARRLSETYGTAFDFSSLAGVPTLGVTGFGAAHAHAPQTGNRERYVYYLLVHIGLGPQGEAGVCSRPGRAQPSAACGELELLQKNLKAGQLRTEVVEDDVEQSLLEQRLGPKLVANQNATLVEITMAAHALLKEDIERLAANTVDTTKADYAAFTGVQIHLPAGVADRVWVGSSFAVLEGQPRELTL